jgi:VacB/RNase II family 3'-5' exoribonuclease
MSDNTDGARDRRELQDIARNAMRANGLEPEFPPAARAQLSRLEVPAANGLRDLRSLPWSSIDNVESRDLDQIEVCLDGDVRSNITVVVAIADVDALVARASPLDAHAAANTTSVYTPAIIFPMLPPELSTDRTSLNEGQDRQAIAIEMTVDPRGEVAASSVYHALVRNQARLAYGDVAAWLDGAQPPAHAARVAGLDRQVALQDAVASRLQTRRQEEGALDFDRSELHPIVDDTGVRELRAETGNRAKELIENLMIAANGACARFLSAGGFPSVRRVVRAPDRWSRIVDLAAQQGTHLPGEPDARALQQFLRARRAAAPDDFADLSLSIIKLLGRGEYVAERAGDPSAHFALAVPSYTHSTAPNRRYPDLVTQRLLKAALARAAVPYSMDDLSALAAHCTRQEDAANKVERLTKKAAAALWLGNRIGETFDAVVTGAGPKGTWVRLARTPVEGRLERGFQGLDVGDRVHVRLISTDPRRGFIDFERT